MLSWLKIPGAEDDVEGGPGGVVVTPVGDAGGVDHGPGQNLLFPHENSGGGKRCFRCVQDLPCDGYKATKNKLSKPKCKCQNCNLAVCDKHLIVACDPCSMKLTLKIDYGDEGGEVNQSLDKSC